MQNRFNAKMQRGQRAVNVFFMTFVLWFLTFSVPLCLCGENWSFKHV